MKRSGTLSACVGMFAMIAVSAVARLAGPGTFDLTWNTVDGGGGTSSGGVLRIDGTIGQSDAGRRRNSHTAISTRKSVVIPARARARAKRPAPPGSGPKRSPSSPPPSPCPSPSPGGCPGGAPRSFLAGLCGVRTAEPPCESCSAMSSS